MTPEHPPDEGAERTEAGRRGLRSGTVDLLLAPLVVVGLDVFGELDSHPLNAPTYWLLVPTAFVCASFVLSTRMRWQQGPRLVIDRARKILLGGLLATPLVTLGGLMHSHEWMLTVVFVWGALHALTLARYALTELRPGESEPVTTVLGKGGALRSATAAAIATGSDFSIFSALLWATGVSAPVATFLGALTGGFINFTLNRTWTFNASGTKLKMARRYVGVSTSSALMNASFVAILLWVPGQLPVVAWLIARGLVFLAWNYPLHRDYVFEHLGKRAGAH